MGMGVGAFRGTAQAGSSGVQRTRREDNLIGTTIVVAKGPYRSSFSCAALCCSIIDSSMRLCCCVHRMLLCAMLVCIMLLCHAQMVSVLPLSCPVLSCPVLSCPVLSFPVLSCPGATLRPAIWY